MQLSARKWKHMHCPEYHTVPLKADVCLVPGAFWSIWVLMKPCVMMHCSRVLGWESWPCGACQLFYLTCTDTVNITEDSAARSLGRCPASIAELSMWTDLWWLTKSQALQTSSCSTLTPVQFLCTKNKVDCIDLGFLKNRNFLKRKPKKTKTLIWKSSVALSWTVITHSLWLILLWNKQVIMMSDPWSYYL